MADASTNLPPAVHTGRVVTVPDTDTGRRGLVLVSLWTHSVPMDPQCHYRSSVSL